MDIPKPDLRYRYRVKVTYAISKILLASCKFIVHTFIAEKGLCSLTHIRGTPDQDKYPYCDSKKYLVQIVGWSD